MTPEEQGRLKCELDNVMARFKCLLKWYPVSRDVKWAIHFEETSIEDKRQAQITEIIKKHIASKKG